MTVEGRGPDEASIADPGRPARPALLAAARVDRITRGVDVRVLIVDDIPEMRRLVELWLFETGVRVVAQASNCDEVTDDLIERHRPSVVVMDMHMPGRDGVKCTRELLRRHPHLLVVAFSSSDDPRVAEAMHAAGAVEHFHKSDLKGLVAWLVNRTRGG